MATAGKTTISKELARRIPNAAYLARDDALYGGLLLVRDGASVHLPPFAEYVQRDTVYPDAIERLETPFGAMLRVIHSNHNGFYLRHAHLQSYQLIGRMTERALELGKVAIVDAWFPPEHFRDGNVRDFLGSAAFTPYPRSLIYLTVGVDVAFNRWKERAASDPESNLRGKAGYFERASFLGRMALEQLPNPPGLEQIPHLAIDTTSRSIKETVALCLSHLSL